MSSNRIKSDKVRINNKNISKKERIAFEKHMTNLFPDLKPGRQRPRNLVEKEKVTEWAEGDLIELKKI